MHKFATEYLESRNISTIEDKVIVRGIVNRQAFFDSLRKSPEINPKGTGLFGPDKALGGESPLVQFDPDILEDANLKAH